MEQERKDGAHGEPATPTPSTPTTTTIGEGGQHPADPNDRGSPGDRSRGQARGSHTRSPILTVYSAHRREPQTAHATTQWHTGHYPSTADTTGNEGGRATGELTAQQQLEDPEPDHAPSQRTDYSARAADRTASTTPGQRTPSLDRTEYSTQNRNYSHIVFTDLKSPP